MMMKKRYFGYNFEGPRGSWSTRACRGEAGRGAAHAPACRLLPSVPARPARQWGGHPQWLQAACVRAPLRASGIQRGLRAQRPKRGGAARRLCSRIPLHPASLPLHAPAPGLPCSPPPPHSHARARSYDLMIQLQLGIRYSIGAVNAVPMMAGVAPWPTPAAAGGGPAGGGGSLQPEDFSHKAKVFFPMAGRCAGAQGVASVVIAHGAQSWHDSEAMARRAARTCSVSAPARFA